MWKFGWPVGGERAGRSHGSRPAMPRHNESYFNETFLYNQTRFNQTLFEIIASALNVYFTPLLVFFGILGNLLSVFVFYTSKLRLQSTSQYLSALALSDTVFLLQLLPPWLNAMQMAPLFHQQGWCQLFVYISYVSSCLSAWLVVAFTVERFVAVLYPLRRNILCTVSRARVIIITLSVLAMTLNVPVLRFATPTKHDCNIDMNYLDQAARFNIIDTGLSFTMPLFVIVVLNSWIVFSVCRLERARLVLSKQPRTGSAPRAAARAVRAAPPRARLHATTAPPRSQQRVTRMLLVVSSVFVLLNLPAYTMRLLAYAYDIDKEEYSDRWDGLQQVALMFFNTNFGINFLLYCLSGQNFRRTLLQGTPWRRLHLRRAAVRRNQFCHPAPASSVSASIVSNCTEGSTNFNTADAGSTPDMRRRLRVDYISRWTFDNSRQRGEGAPAQAQTQAQAAASDALELVALQRGA